MKLQLTLLSKWLIFLGFISIVFFSLSIYLYFSREDESHFEGVSCGVVGNPSFCGTKSYEFEEHKGYEIIRFNCLSCHSIYQNRYKVGPSLCGTTRRIDERTFNLLLYKDSKQMLPKTKYYKNLIKGTNLEIHSTLKFEFTDKQKESIRSYIDTITVLQE